MESLHQIPLPRSSKNHGGGGRRSGRARGLKTQENEASESTKRDAYELTETAGAGTGPAWVCTGSAVDISWLPVWCFHEILECANGWGSDTCACFGDTFPLLSCLV